MSDHDMSGWIKAVDRMPAIYQNVDLSRDGVTVLDTLIYNPNMGPWNKVGLWWRPHVELDHGHTA